LLVALIHAKELNGRFYTTSWSAISDDNYTLFVKVDTQCTLIL